MIRPTGLLLLLVLSFPAPSQAQDRSAQLRKEIADLKATLAEKEAELSRPDPANEVEYLDAADLKPGTAGEFRMPGVMNVAGQSVTVAGAYPAPFKVVSVLDGSRMVVQVGEVLILVKGHPTKALAEGKVFIPDSQYRVLGTEKVKDSKGRDRTLYAVEPYTPRKK